MNPIGHTDYVSGLVYRGQYYDAGKDSAAKCSFCGQVLRFVFVLKDMAGKPMPIGTCCFDRFDDGPIRAELYASQVLLKAAVGRAERDAKEQATLCDVSIRAAQWRAARKKAKKLIKWYQENTKSKWLTRPLFDLRQEADRKPEPGKKPQFSLRWYAKHGIALETGISQAMGHMSLAGQAPPDSFRLP